MKNTHHHSYTSPVPQDTLLRPLLEGSPMPHTQPRDGVKVATFPDPQILTAPWPEPEPEREREREREREYVAINKRVITYEKTSGEDVLPELYPITPQDLGTGTNLLDYLYTNTTEFYFEPNNQIKSIDTISMPDSDISTLPLILERYNDPSSTSTEASASSIINSHESRPPVNTNSLSKPCPPETQRDNSTVESSYTCDGELKTADNLKKLIKDKTLKHCDKMGAFPCYICEANFTVEKQWLDHLKNHNARNSKLRFCTITDDNNKKYQCSECEKWFGSSETRRRHLRKHMNKDDSRVNFECSTCSKKYKTMDSLRFHHKTAKTTVCQRITPCNVCDRECHDIAQLQTHIRSHKDTHPRICRICYSAFPTKTGLIGHGSKHKIKS